MTTTRRYSSTTRWVRQGPGLYETTNGQAYATFIPGHWELATVANTAEGIEPDVTDHTTLADAKAAYARVLNGEATR